MLERLAPYARIAIAGPHAVGKTTLLRELHRADASRHCVDTDEYLAHRFQDVPELVNARLAQHERWVVAGTQVCRCLRGARDGARAPLHTDCVVWLDTPHLPWTADHRAQAKGLRRIFDEWLASENAKGVAIVWG